MSGRPVRTKRQPARLTPQVPKTTKKTRVAKGGVKKTAKIEKSIIKDKKTLISYIEKKIGKASGKNRLAWITLNHIYSDYTDTQITAKFKKYSNADIDRYLNIQHDIINKPGSTLSNTLPSTVDIQMDDTKLINFLVMIWLDMAHDGTFSKKETFGNFLKSDYVKFLIKTPINGIKITKTIEKLIDNHILINKNGNLYRHADADKNIKNNIHNIWGDGSGMYFLHSTSKIRSKIKKPKLPIYMSLDSEDSNLTELIKSSKIGNSYYIKPLINVANLLDPGRGGSSTGQRGGTMDRLTRQLFRNEPYIHYKFDVNTYAFNFGDHMSVNIYIDDTKFNISVNGVPLKMGTTTNEAKKGDTIQKISKFMGDFAQILVVAHQYKRGLRSVSGTLDGVFVGITAFVQKELLGMKPRIMFDNSTYGTNGIIIHGFDDLLIKNNTKTQSPSVVKYIKNMNANAGINQNTRATTQMLLSKPNNRSKSVSKGNAPSRNNTAEMNRAPVRRAAPSRNNTAEMKRPNSSVSQRKRPRSTMGSVGSYSGRRVKQIKISASNRSSAAKTNGSPNSVTQSRLGTGKVESITRTKSPESVARTKSAKFESVTRTTSARPATSNSARSNQTRG
jgi:hypothetical protein